MDSVCAVDPTQSRGTLPSGEPLLAVSDLRKAYGSNEALRGISFEVQSSEKVALLGPNGAGKTTLIRTISGRIRPSSGTVQLAGKSIRDAGAMQHLGMIPQDIAIYPDLTAKENLQAFGRLHGLRGKRLADQIEWALDWIGLADRAGELTRGFSGGMKRRVNIACGVLHRPKLLLLDEPTVGVDPQSRQRIYDMLDGLHSLGTSILLTTHHLDEAQERCDRIVIVDHGQVIADGTLDDIVGETVGNERRVLLTIEGMMVAAPPGLKWDPAAQLFNASINDISDELPQLLHRIESLGGTVVNLTVHQPNLHDVFLRLTGKELRE